MIYSSIVNVAIKHQEQITYIFHWLELSETFTERSRIWDFVESVLIAIRSFYRVRRYLNLNKTPFYAQQTEEVKDPEKLRRVTEAT